MDKVYRIVSKVGGEWVTDRRPDGTARLYDKKGAAKSALGNIRGANQGYYGVTAEYKVQVATPEWEDVN